MSDSSEEDSSYLEPYYTVIDHGSYSMKSGFAGDDAPRAVCPNIVGETMRSGNRIPGMQQQVYFLADDAISTRCTVKISRPIEKGVIVNFDDMERLWQHTFYNELRINMFKGVLHDEKLKGVLIEQSPLTDTDSKEKTAQIMFEKFNVPSLCLVVSEQMALFSSGGRSEGLVVGSGYDMTYAVPVVQGRCLHKAMQHWECGGEHLTSYMNHLLSSRGYAFGSTYARNHVESMKGYFAFVAGNFPFYSEFFEANYPDLVTETLLQFWGEELYEVCNLVSQYFPTNLIQTRQYHIPYPYDARDAGPRDNPGEYVSIAKEQFECPELLFGSQREPFPFRPMWPSSRLNKGNKYTECDFEGQSLQKLIYDSISLCDDTNTQEMMYKNIVLTGGNTMFQGIDSRLEMELQNLLAQNGHKNIDVNVVAVPERRYSSWIGGSVFCESGAFEENCITKEEYEEEGSSAVHRHEANVNETQNFRAESFRFCFKIFCFIDVHISTLALCHDCH